MWLLFETSVHTRYFCSDIYQNATSKLVQVTDKNIALYQTKAEINSKQLNRSVFCLEDFLRFATHKPIVCVTTEQTLNCIH